MTVRKTPLMMLAVLATLAWSSTAFAQDWGTDPEGGDWEAPPDNTNPPPDNTQPPGQNTQPPGQNTQPPAQNTPPPQQNNWNNTNQGGADTETPPSFNNSGSGSDDDGQTDHQQVVGHIGFGWFGIQQIAYPTAFDMGSVTLGSLDLPVVGARVWFSELLGLDIALGFLFSTGGVSVDDVTNNVFVGADAPTTTAFMLHGGLPLAFYNDSHYKFLLVPELEIGFGTGDDGGLTNLTGFTFRVGARVGTEIQFGFMGIPHLALQASVGLGIQFQSVSADQCIGSCADSNIITSTDNFSIRTLDFDEPWNIFTGNVAAIYYL